MASKYLSCHDSGYSDKCWATSGVHRWFARVQAPFQFRASLRLAIEILLSFHMHPKNQIDRSKGSSVPHNFWESEPILSGGSNRTSYQVMSHEAHIYAIHVSDWRRTSFVCDVWDRPKPENVELGNKLSSDGPQYIENNIKSSACRKYLVLLHPNSGALHEWRDRTCWYLLQQSTRCARLPLGKLPSDADYYIQHHG